MEINWGQKELCKWTYFIKYKLKSTKISKLGILVYPNKQQVSNAFEDKDHQSIFEIGVMTQSQLGLVFRVKDVDEALKLLSVYGVEKLEEYTNELNERFKDKFNFDDCICNSFTVDTLNDDCVVISFDLWNYTHIKSILKHICRYDNINNSVIDEISDIMDKCCKGL